MTTLLRVLVGSRAAGLARPDSDFDYIEVFQRHTLDMLGLKDLGKDSVHSVTTENDTTHHELGKFLRLAVSGTPSAVQVFFSPALEINETGQKLLNDVPEMALSQDLKPRFLGFANHRLKTNTQKSRSTAYRLLFHLTELWKFAKMTFPLPDPQAAMNATYDDVLKLMAKTENVVNGPSALPQHADLDALHDWLVGARLAELNKLPKD